MCCRYLYFSLFLSIFLFALSMHEYVFVLPRTRIHMRVTDTRSYPPSERERETERNTMANGILLFQIGPARISPSLLTGSEECRHEIILQYLTVGLFPLYLPLALPTPQRSNNHRVRNPKVNPNHWHPPRRAIRPCLRRSFITLV